MDAWGCVQRCLITDLNLDEEDDDLIPGTGIDDDDKLPEKFYYSKDENYNELILAAQKLQSSASVATTHTSCICTVVTQNGFELPAFIAATQAILCQTTPVDQWILLTDTNISPYVKTTISVAQKVLEKEDIQVKVIPGDDLLKNLQEICQSIDTDVVVIHAFQDVLSPSALSHIHHYWDEHPDTDWIYADIDLLDNDQSRHSPWFKPDWSPEMAFGVNLGQGILAISKETVARINFNNLSPVCWHWDLCLHLARLADGAHIPLVLSHRIPMPTSKGQLSDIQAILQKHLQEQCQVNDELTLNRISGLEDNPFFRDAVYPQWEPQNTGRVSIIIPSKDKADYLGQCLQTIYQYTQYADFEVIVVDTGSEEPATQTLYDQYANHSNFRVVQYTATSFNFSAACNLGAANATGDFLLFLNNDVEMRADNWLRQLVQWFDIPQVGMVGSLLLFPDETVQHAGVVVGLSGLADHVFWHMQPDAVSPFGSSQLIRNFSAVTGACMLIRREVFEEVGRFDETFTLVFSDIDLCVNVIRHGYRIVNTPQVQLLHHESVTHKRNYSRLDLVIAIEQMFPELCVDDPYYNPNLSYVFKTPMLTTQPSHVDAYTPAHDRIQIMTQHMLKQWDELQTDEVYQRIEALGLRPHKIE